MSHPSSAACFLVLPLLPLPSRGCLARRTSEGTRRRRYTCLSSYRTGSEYWTRAKRIGWWNGAYVKSRKELDFKHCSPARYVVYVDQTACWPRTPESFRSRNGGKLSARRGAGCYLQWHFKLTLPHNTVDYFRAYGFASGRGTRDMFHG